jgi:hypothetical protein
VSDLPDWRATFVDPGYALACDPTDSDSIASAFMWASRHRDGARAIASRGWDRLRADWNYESQFEPVLRGMWTSPHVMTGQGSFRRADGHEEEQCVS